MSLKCNIRVSLTWKIHVLCIIITETERTRQITNSLSHWSQSAAWTWWTKRMKIKVWNKVYRSTEWYKSIISKYKYSKKNIHYSKQPWCQRQEKKGLQISFFPIDLTETINSRGKNPSLRPVAAGNVETRASSNAQEHDRWSHHATRKSHLTARYFSPRFHVASVVIPRPVLIKRASIDRFVERTWNRARMKTETAKLTRDRGETAG